VRQEGHQGHPRRGLPPTPSLLSMSASEVSQESRSGGAQTGRLVSLDAFRGITIIGMILVNNPGSWSHAALVDSGAYLCRRRCVTLPLAL